MDAKKPWRAHLRHAFMAPANLAIGLGAAVASVVMLNPLPLVLYALGEPVWLYHGTMSGRYDDRIKAEWSAETEARTAEEIEWLRGGVETLIRRSPCYGWIGDGRIPDYLDHFRRLTQIRDQVARRVEARDDVAKALEEDIVARMDDMLRSYLRMVKERLLFLCALAGVYPDLEAAPSEARKPSSRLRRLFFTEPEDEETGSNAVVTARYVTLETRLKLLQVKIDELNGEIERQPENREVFQTNVEMYGKLMAELRERGRMDQRMAAQLKAFPDQFEIILSKMAMPQADVTEVVGDMKLLLEQTEETVSFAEEMRSGEDSTFRRARAATRLMH